MNNQENQNKLDFEPGTCIDKGDGLIKRNEKELLASLDKKVEAEKGEKAKKKSLVKSLLWAAAMIALSVTLAYTIIVVAIDFLGLGTQRKIEVEIKQGTTVAGIAEVLEEAGVIESPLAFRLYVKLAGGGADFKYGVYVMSDDMGYSDIARALVENGAVAETVKVLIPEGASVDEIAKRLEEKGICKASQFKKIAREAVFDYPFLKDIPKEVHYKLEGYLYPDTYYFYAYNSEECARMAAEKMLSNFEEKVYFGLAEEIKNSAFSLHEIMTMASIVDMEAGGASYVEKQKVAAVFFNRLAWTSEPNLLGSSPTANYPYGGGIYNTNKNRGLPPGPLCAPGLDSVKATLTPAENFDKCYFVTDKNHQFYYNKTYNQHLSTIQDLKNKGLWQ